jgi:hypothetical protein
MLAGGVSLEKTLYCRENHSERFPSFSTESPHSGRTKGAHFKYSNYRCVPFQVIRWSWLRGRGRVLRQAGMLRVVRHLPISTVPPFANQSSSGRCRTTLNNRWNRRHTGHRDCQVCRWFVDCRWLAAFLWYDSGNSDRVFHAADAAAT